MSMLQINHDRQQEPPAAYGDCGHEVYRNNNDFRAEWEGKMLCPECWTAAVERALRENPIQVALEMQLHVERYI